MPIHRRICFTNSTESLCEILHMTNHIKVIPVVPRGLSRVNAAAYIGVSPSLFDQMVKANVMPKPKRFQARVFWDREQLDECFAGLPDDADRPKRSVWDEMD